MSVRSFVEAADGTSLYFGDWSAGRLAVCIGGGPFDAGMREPRMPHLAKAWSRQ